MAILTVLQYRKTYRVVSSTEDFCFVLLHECSTYTIFNSPKCVLYFVIYLPL